MGIKVKRRRRGRGFTKREARIVRSQLRWLRESAGGDPGDLDISAAYYQQRLERTPTRRGKQTMAHRPKLTEAQRAAEVRYLRDSAISAVQKFAEVYRGQKPFGMENALDTLATFREAYERHSGQVRSMEARAMNVTHTKGCEKTFQMALPGSHRLATSEDGIKVVGATCPHCDQPMKVRLPEGMAAVPVDGGSDAGDGGGMRSPSNANRNVHGDDTGGDFRDEEDDEGGDDLFSADEDEAYDDRRGPTPDESPRSGPYRPGSGDRDSLRQYYDERGTKLHRLAKHESNPRLRSAALTFLRVMEAEARRRRD